jgi:general secretion pathway protein J
MRLPHKTMQKAEGGMKNTLHSASSISHSTAASSKKSFFGAHSTHGQNQQAGISRRSPGRKALFSSVHPAPASWTASAGFTLIEVLLALMISAIVLVIIGSFFAGALKVQQHVNANLDDAMPISRALTLLEKDLKNAVAPGGLLAGPLQSGSVSGGVDANDGIQIYTTTGIMRPNTPWSEIQRVTYGLQTPSDSSATGKDLVRTVTRNLLTTATDEDDEQYLASGIESMSYSYFDGANWLDTWGDTTQTNLPLAVRVNVQMAVANNSSEAKPDPIQLLVPMMVQTHTNDLDNSDNGGTNSASSGQ